MTHSVPATAPTDPNSATGGSMLLAAWEAGLLVVHADGTVHATEEGRRFVRANYRPQVIGPGVGVPIVISPVE